MSGGAEEVKVDETSISPVERRNSLEKHLQMRPDPKDLKDRHILLDTNAAPLVFDLSTLYRSGELTEPSALQSAAQELERQRATDSLKKGLEKRPEKEELIERTLSIVESDSRQGLPLHRQHPTRLQCCASDSRTAKRA